MKRRIYTYALRMCEAVFLAVRWPHVWAGLLRMLFKPGIEPVSPIGLSPEINNIIHHGCGLVLVNYSRRSSGLTAVHVGLQPIARLHSEMTDFIRPIRMRDGPSGRLRSCGPLLPKQVLSLAELRADVDGVAAVRCPRSESMDVATAQEKLR